MAGTWKDLTDSVNTMGSNLTAQVRNIAEVTTAVARGDLSRKITVDVKGEILELKNTINTMVDQLNGFASEVTRVAREVGTEGKLGGQAQVSGVGGTWKDLTDNVNFMASNLTDQVRGIAPGSLTFEVQDIPAIAAVAHRHGARVLMDNTWGTPYLFRSFEHGVDVSIHAATKYICGHSDAMLGAIITNEESFLPVRSGMAQIGHSAAPDDVFFALRGMRTLSVRLERHQKNALEVARWLQTRPEVSRVLTLPCPRIPATRSGSAISSAPAACSGWC